MMDKKIIESLNVTLPRLGFGCMRFPQVGGKIDFNKSKEMILYALDNGINYFDTAYMYHDGESETFLGEVLSGIKRESYFLTDKLPVWEVNSDEDAERLFNEQLKKCNTSYFDFYLLHSLTKKNVEKIEKYDLYNFILNKKKEGKVKHIGFSFHDNSSTLKKLVESYKWDFVQLQINYYDWAENDANDLYEVLEKNNIPCFVMEPVRGGFLSSFAPQVNRIFLDFDDKKSISSYALRWVAQLKNVAIILSGMSSMEQIQDNINTFTNIKALNEKEINLIDSALVELRKIKPIPCTGCRYCMDCSFGVDIPGIFLIYNEYKKAQNKYLAHRKYFVLKEDSELASSCEKCGECMTKCPQHIDIPTELEKIHQEFIIIKEEMEK